MRQYGSKRGREIVLRIIGRLRFLAVGRVVVTCGVILARQADLDCVLCGSSVKKTCYFHIHPPYPPLEAKCESPLTGFLGQKPYKKSRICDTFETFFFRGDFFNGIE